MSKVRLPLITLQRVIALLLIVAIETDLAKRERILFIRMSVIKTFMLCLEVLFSYLVSIIFKFLAFKDPFTYQLFESKAWISKIKTQI